MKKFLFKISILLIILFILLNVFDIVYTYTFSNSSPRNKTQYTLQLKNQKIDYVFIGSSRVQNDINTKLVEKLTSKKALNLGVDGARLDQTFLLLKILLDNKIRFEKVFIQVDYIYNYGIDTLIVSPESLPFIKNNKVVENHLKHKNPNFHKYYNFPFYRYAANDFKIGFREFFFTAISYKSAQDFRDGYQPINGKFKDINYKLPTKIAKKNYTFEAIDSFCKKNKINIVYFCSPFCSKTLESDYILKLKQKIPKLKDFSKSIKNDSLFVDCGHLNEKGAAIFTKIVVEDCILNAEYK